MKGNIRLLVLVIFKTINCTDIVVKTEEGDVYF